MACANESPNERTNSRTNGRTNELQVGENLKDVGAEIVSSNPNLVAQAMKAATPSPEAAFNIIAKQVRAHG